MRDAPASLHLSERRQLVLDIRIDRPQIRQAAHNRGPRLRRQLAENLCRGTWTKMRRDNRNRLRVLETQHAGQRRDFDASQKCEAWLQRCPRGQAGSSCFRAASSCSWASVAKCGERRYDLASKVLLFVECDRGLI